MTIISIICSYCNKTFLRDLRHANENKKLQQKQYCSHFCFGESRKKRIKLLCDNPPCNKIFERTNAEISPRNFCSPSCSAQVSNAKRSKRIRICANEKCSNHFTGKRKYCSLRCIPYKKSKYTEEIIITKIQEFVKEYGRIPTKQELMTIYTPIRKLFTTWNNAIIAAGFTPNPVMFARKHLAKDGHTCDSLAERIIDDWLSRRQISHIRTVKYPGNPNLTVDFVVGEYWIEFFGLYGEHTRYDQLREEKLQLVKQHNLQFIELYPKDIAQLGIKLKQILQVNLF